MLLARLSLMLLLIEPTKQMHWMKPMHWAKVRDQMKVRGQMKVRRQMKLKPLLLMHLAQ